MLDYCRILVLGANGSVGDSIAKALAVDKKLIQTHVSGNRDVDGMVRVDWEGNWRSDLEHRLSGGNFDVVINALAVLGEASSDKSIEVRDKINVDVPSFIADLTQSSDTRFIHISSNAVFSPGPDIRLESDPGDAKSEYGTQKLKVDKYLSDKATVIRAAIQTPKIHPGSVKSKLSELPISSVFRVSNVGFWNGLSKQTFARFVYEMIRSGIFPQHILHLNSAKPIAIIDYLRLVSTLLNRNDIIFEHENDHAFDGSQMLGTENPAIRDQLWQSVGELYNETSGMNEVIKAWKS